jgi:hypothetical protein
MKKLIVILCVLFFGIAGTANATLLDRGGGLIYDDVLDITWLQDANYAQTSGYDADGMMTWYDAIVWAEKLEYYDSVREVTGTDWRLPQTLPVDGVSYNYEYKALSDGDVKPIPEPATMLLLGSGLIVLSGFTRRFKQ